MIVLHLIDWIDAFMWHYLGWLAVLLIDIIAHANPGTRRRIMRGKFTRWRLRIFGPWVWFYEVMYLMCVAFPCAIAGFMFPASLFYIYLLVALIVDLITGSDDPPFRRWRESASEAVKKLKISPPPRPVIDRA